MGAHFPCRATAIVAVAVGLIPSILQAQAVVRGVLYDDANGRPVQGTVMLVNPSTDETVVYSATDSAGNFLLKVRTGSYQIAAIRPGYKSMLSAAVPLENGEQLTLRVPIAENGDPQHKIGVLEHIRPGDRSSASPAEAMRTSAFAARRALGNGAFFDRARLEKSGFNTLGQFLQTVPGVTIRDPNSAGSMQMTRSMALNAASANTPNACHVGWFLDGRRIDIPGRSDPMTDALGSMNLDVIDAVEVFRGLSEMPAEFAAPDLRCGAVSIWTRTS